MDKTCGGGPLVGFHTAKREFDILSLLFIIYKMDILQTDGQCLSIFTGGGGGGTVPVCGIWQSTTTQLDTIDVSTSTVNIASTSIDFSGTIIEDGIYAITFTLILLVSFAVGYFVVKFFE